MYDLRFKKYSFVAGCLLLGYSFAQADLELPFPENKTAKVSSERNYTNPVLHADYSDPDVVASPDGKTFYMTASSFQCVPGLPILKSQNLVDWQLVNHALEAVPPVEVYGDGKTHHGDGVWAPCIKYHNGEYYIYWGDPDFGIYMVKTHNPEGKWSSPVLVKEGKGLIDTTPLWDEDGKAYLANAWAKSRAGFNGIITISEMSPDGTTLISEPKMVYDGNYDINYTVEGPKLYKRGEYYYILAPAGGVEKGWQIALRSKNIYGPYEAKTVMAQGNADINGPHQGGWVTTSEGEDWFLNFQDKGPFGRVVHLNPLEWINDWPVIGFDEDGDGCGEPVKSYRMPKLSSDKGLTDSTESEIIDLFQWHSNYNTLYGFPLAQGVMRLYSHAMSNETENLWEVPNLWLMKFPGEEFTFTSKIKISQKVNENGISSGIVVMGLDYCRLGLTSKDGKFILQMAECKDAEHGSPENIYDIITLNPDKIYESGAVPLMDSDIWLQIKITKDALCQFYYSTDGKDYIRIDKTFKAKEGKWIGAKIGFYSIMPPTVKNRGWIDIEDISVSNS